MHPEFKLQEIFPPEICKSNKQASPLALDLQFSKEMFPVFQTQGVLTYILHIIKMFVFLQIPFYTFLMFSNDIYKFCDVTSSTHITQHDSGLRK